MASLFPFPHPSLLSTSPPPAPGMKILSTASITCEPTDKRNTLATDATNYVVFVLNISTTRKALLPSPLASLNFDLSTVMNLRAKTVRRQLSFLIMQPVTEQRELIL